LKRDHQTRLFWKPLRQHRSAFDLGGEMETIFERVGALDVHQRGHAGGRR